MTQPNPPQVGDILNAAADLLEKPTCATCRHIGIAYWGDRSDYGGRTHFCMKSDLRRRDAMKPSGDYAEDFMQNFRTFFDANAPNAACAYYEEREALDPERTALLQAMAAQGGRAAYEFFSRENALCEKLNGIFVERDKYARRAPSDGTRDWQLTRVGEAWTARLSRTQAPSQ